MFQCKKSVEMWHNKKKKVVKDSKQQNKWKNKLFLLSYMSFIAYFSQIQDEIRNQIQEIFAFCKNIFEHSKFPQMFLICKLFWFIFYVIYFTLFFVPEEKWIKLLLTKILYIQPTHLLSVSSYLYICTNTLTHKRN